MNKKIIFWSLGLLMLVIIGLVYYNNLFPEISKDDLVIESEIQKLDKDTYLVELEITRTKKETKSNFIYPIIQGLGNLSNFEGVGSISSQHIPVSSLPLFSRHEGYRRSEFRRLI